MTFGSLAGIGPGTPVFVGGEAHLPVSETWLGRVIDPLGRALDGKGQLLAGERTTPVRRPPPNAAIRSRLGPRIDLGVKALNAFATCRQGQRLGLFAGSGVGKSTLLSMLARYTNCDVAVIALVGERGRELREFIEDDLGPEGLARSVLVVATSDQPPLMRRECAYAAACVAEYFRDEGKSVLLLMDSVTRFCLALRGIGLSAGEPPTTRGYPQASSPNCRNCWNGPAPGCRAPARSPACSRCWWRVTTRTSRSPTQCVASWMDTLCSTVVSARADDIPPWTCCGRSLEQCRA